MIFGTPSSPKEDKVIATYNIYLSPRSSSDMHVFQYPLRDKNRPYEGDKIQLFCTDGIPNNDDKKKKEEGVIHSGSRLRMSLTLDTFGSKSFSSTNSYANGYSYNLQSKPFKPRSDYVVAYIDKNGLHFSPVSSIQQFTPLLKDMNQQSSRDGSSGTELEELPTRLILDGPLDRAQRESLRQRSDMLRRDVETTKEIQVFQIGSSVSLAARAHLASPTFESFERHLKLSREQIENCLFPPDVYCGKGEVSTTAVVRRFAAHYPLEQRVRELMLRCQILPLDVITRRVFSYNETASEKEVLKILFNCCFWMHGVWVSIKCPSFKGVCDTLRGVILSYFFSSPQATVSRPLLNSLVVSSTQRKYIKEILETLAILNNNPNPENRLWKLRYVSDDDAHASEQFKKLNSLFPTEMSRHQKRITEAFSRRDGLVRAMKDGKFFSIFNSNPGGLDGMSSREVERIKRPEISLSPSDQKIVDTISLNIRTILLKDGVLNKEALKAKLIEDKPLKYPSATSTVLRVALQGLVQDFTSTTWILKEIGEREIDRFRPDIIKTALTMSNFTLVQFMEALNNRITSDRIPEDVVKRVLSEIANFSQGDRVYHVKNGLNNN